MFRFNVLAPGGGGYPYTPPDLTMGPATMPGLSGYQFNAANSGDEDNPQEMMDCKARPPLFVPNQYMTRGLRTQQKLGAGRGILPTVIVTGRV
jgi:hypothetical protein